jgi:hypothetical protein
MPKKKLRLMVIVTPLLAALCGCYHHVVGVKGNAHWVDQVHEANLPAEDTETKSTKVPSKMVPSKVAPSNTG